MKIVIPESIQKVLNSKNTIYQGSKINQTRVIQRKRAAADEPLDVASPKRAKLDEEAQISLEESPLKLWTLFEDAEPLPPDSRSADSDEIEIREDDESYSQSHEKNKETSPMHRDAMEKLNSDAAIDALERFSQDQCGVASGSLDALLDFSQKHTQRAPPPVDAPLAATETQRIDFGDEGEEEDGKEKDDDIVNMSVYKGPKLASRAKALPATSSSMLLQPSRNSTPLKLFYDEDEDEELF